MASVVDICNMALSNIRAGSINSLTESSLQAQVCSLKYETMLNMCLRTNVWGFARKLEALALTTTEIYNWQFAYSYPSDCLQINRLVGESEALDTNAAVYAYPYSYYPFNYDLIRQELTRRKIPYEIFNFEGTKLIASNDQNLYIEYIVKVTDPNLFTEDFILALSHLLASEIAIPIVGVENGRQLRSDSLTMYKEYINAAAVNDINEGQIDESPSDYELVRR